MDGKRRYTKSGDAQDAAKTGKSWQIVGPGSIPTEILK